MSEESRKMAKLAVEALEDKKQRISSNRHQ